MVTLHEVFFFQAEDGIRGATVTGVQTCALPILQREIRGVRMPRTLAVFEVLVPTVLGQQVTTEEARESYRHLVNALGDKAPGPHPLRVPPSPEVLARTPYWSFHRFGVERRRADVIIRAARSAKRLEQTTQMDMPSAYRRLRAFPGIG